MFLCSCDSSKNVSSSEQIEQIEKVEQTDKVSATSTTKQTEQTKTVSKTSTPTSTQKFSYSTVIISSPTKTKKEFPEADAYTFDEETKPFEEILHAYAELEKSGYLSYDESALGYVGLTVGTEETHNLYWDNFILKYAFYDLNNDGAKELIIGSTNGGYINDYTSCKISGIYTLQNGKPISAFHGDYRQYHALNFSENGTCILTRGYGRHGFAGEYFYEMNSAGEFILIDEIYTDNLEYLDDSRGRETDGKYFNITEKEYGDLLRKYGDDGYYPKEEIEPNRIPLEWKPIVGLIDESFQDE